MLYHLNDIETEIVTYIERQFLKTLEGGCTAPIGALARYNERKIRFIFKVFCFRLTERENKVDKVVPIEEWKNWVSFLLKRS
jgi:hydroxymethylbilane synthase